MTTSKKYHKFPSGRPVSAVRKDAKRRKKEDGIPLHQALDLLAQENGINKPWAEAIASLEVMEPD